MSAPIRSEINITPLVDVVLVLLIIFMVLTPMMQKQMDVILPERDGIDVTPATDAQHIFRVGADGAWLLDGSLITEANASSRILDAYRAAKAEEAGKGAPVLFVDVDDHARYGRAVQALDAIRVSGAHWTVALMKESMQ